MLKETGQLRAITTRLLESHYCQATRQGMYHSIKYQYQPPSVHNERAIEEFVRSLRTYIALSTSKKKVSPIKIVQLLDALLFPLLA